MAGPRSDGRKASKGGAGWWQAGDGRSYPPSLARHPAAQGDPGALRAREDQTSAAPPAGQDERPGWGPWTMLAATLLLAFVVVVGSYAVATRTEPVETRGRPTPVATEPTVSSGLPVPDVPTAPAETAPVTAGPEPSTPGPSTGPTSAAPDPTATTPVRSAPTATEPARMPQIADDCKHGGWADLVDDRDRPFPNQGQCVSFANRNR